MEFVAWVVFIGLCCWLALVTYLTEEDDDE